MFWLLGGLDIAVSEKLAIRLVDADFDLTRFGNNSTGGNPTAIENALLLGDLLPQMPAFVQALP